MDTIQIVFGIIIIVLMYEVYKLKRREGFAGGLTDANKTMNYTVLIACV